MGVVRLPSFLSIFFLFFNFILFLFSILWFFYLTLLSHTEKTRSQYVVWWSSSPAVLLGASKLLFVMILVAQSWSFCSWLIWVTPQHPRTEKQYQEWGFKNSTIKGFQSFESLFGQIHLIYKSNFAYIWFIWFVYLANMCFFIQFQWFIYPISISF